jgi:hypothetical protein
MEATPYGAGAGVHSIEVSIRGQWVSVPAAVINGHTVVVRGRWITMAEINDEYWTEGELEDPEGFVKSWKAQSAKGLKADVLTFSQKLPNVTPKHPYPVDWDNVAAIPLTSYENWLKKLSQDTRRNIKTAAKRGVTTRLLRFDEYLVRGIMDINNEFPVRQGRAFHHYGKDFSGVQRDYASFADRSDYIGAFFQDEMIAFLKIVRIGQTAAIMQLLSKMSHHDKRAPNALIARAVEYYVDQKASYLTYIRYRYGKKRQSPLTEFKRRNRFEEIAIPRFYLPLTPKGRVAIGLNLHKSLVEVLPERLTYALLDMRARWHARGTEDAVPSQREATDHLSVREDPSEAAASHGRAERT